MAQDSKSRALTILERIIDVAGSNLADMKYWGWEITPVLDRPRIQDRPRSIRVRLTVILASLMFYQSAS